MDFYIWLNEMARSIAQPLYTLASGINAAGITALLLGMVGATAPCQFTSNSSAMALVTKQMNRKMAWVQTGYFVFGKSLFYMGLGLIAMLFGLTIQDIPLLNGFALQKIAGPLLIIIGIMLIGIIPLRMRMLDKLRERINKSLNGKSSAFGLGVAMGFFFCPTLFGLFFGLVIPKGSFQWTSLADPFFFSIGTAFPLILFTLLISSGARLSMGILPSTFRFHTAFKWLSGSLFVLTGIYETIGYWFI